MSVLPATAQEAAVDTTATMKDQTLDNVTVTTRRASVRSLAGAINGKDILRDELFKAACCAVAGRTDSKVSPAKYIILFISFDIQLLFKIYKAYMVPEWETY